MTSDKVRRLFKRGFCRHSITACMVLDPMELRYFAGPAAIIMVGRDSYCKGKDAYPACSKDFCLCESAELP